MFDSVETAEPAAQASRRGRHCLEGAGPVGEHSEKQRCNREDGVEPPGGMSGAIAVFGGHEVISESGELRTTSIAFRPCGLVL